MENIGNIWKPLIVCGMSDPTVAASLKETCQFKHIIILINNVISDAILLSTFVVVGVLIFHGFKLIMAQGKPGALTTAKDGILNVLKGYAVIIAAWFIVYTIMNVLVGPGIFASRQTMMRNIFLITIISLAIISFSSMSVVHAQTTATCGTATTNKCPPTTQITLDNPFKAVCGSAAGCGVIDLLKAIVDNILMPIGGVLAVLGFIWSGFMYVTAQGNPTGITKATTSLQYTAIGTAILLGAYAIVEVLTGTLKQFGALK